MGLKVKKAVDGGSNPSGAINNFMIKIVVIVMEKYRISVVDAVIIRNGKIYLQKRAMGIWKGTWVLPGGKVEIGEDLSTAVVREVKEETNMDAEIVAMIGIYDSPDRDPEQNGVGVAFLCSAKGEPAPNSEATEGKFFSFDELPENIGFDHATIIEDSKKLYEYLGKQGFPRKK